MAATNFTPIQLYHSTTASAAPTAGNLAAGELAINTLDEKLYFKNSAGTVKLLASAAGAAGDVVGPATSTDNAVARFDGTTGKLIQNSVVTIADTTGNMAGVGTLGVGAITTSGALTYGGVTLSNSVTGTGSMVLSASPTLTGTLAAAAANFSGAVALGDAAADNITVNGTVTSNLIFTDNTYDIGASSATRPRNLFLAGNATVGGDIVLTGSLDLTNLEVTNIKAKDGTAGMQIADSTGVVSFTANPVLSGGTANGVTFLNASKVLTSGSALTFDGTTLVGNAAYGTGTAALILKNTSAAVLANIVEQQFWAADTFTGLTQKGAFGLDTTTGVGNQYGSFYWKLSNAGAPTEQMRLTSTGLGIGTSSPNYLATLYKASLPVLQLANSTSGSTAADGLLIYLNGANATISNEEAGALNFQTSGLLRATLDSSGNLGIGTSSPAHKLVVQQSDTTAYAASSASLVEPAGGTNTQILNVGSGGFASLRFAALSGSYSQGYLGFINTTGVGGAFVFGQRTGGSSYAEQMRLDSSGNLGLGVTPSGWGGGFKAFETTGTSLGSNAAGSSYYLQNSYYNGTNFIYTTTLAASYYSQVSGQHRWFNAPSGTAGDAITFTQAMTLDASGNLGIGTTSPAFRLDVQAPTGVIKLTATTGTNASYFRADNTGGILYVGLDDSTASTFGTAGAYGTVIQRPASTAFNINRAGTVDFFIDTTGNVGIGTSSPGEKLDVNGDARVGNATAGTNRQLIINGVVNKASRIDFQESGTNRWLIGNGAASENGNFEIYDATNGNNLVMTRSGNLGLGVTPSASNLPTFESEYGLISGKDEVNIIQSAYYNSGFKYSKAEAAGRYLMNSGIHSWHTAPSGTAGNAISFTQAMTLDASGNLLIGTTTRGVVDASAFNLDVSNSVAYFSHANGTAGGIPFQQFGYNAGVIGSITQSGTTAVLYNTTSDQRLKENIQDAAPASALIDAIQVRQYDWKSDGSHQRYGFVAQELVTVAPEAVHQPADPDDMMAVDYSKLVPMLVKEIQSLRQRLAAAGI
jgi:hypothetical protein